MGVWNAYTGVLRWSYRFDKSKKKKKRLKLLKTKKMLFRRGGVVFGMYLYQMSGPPPFVLYSLNLFLWALLRKGEDLPMALFACPPYTLFSLPPDFWHFVHCWKSLHTYHLQNGRRWNFFVRIPLAGWALSLSGVDYRLLKSIIIIYQLNHLFRRNRIASYNSSFFLYSLKKKGH